VDKAFKFAANCPRHQGDSGAMVKVRITFTKAKYVRSDNLCWQAEGYDACRTEYTSRSTHPEWCLKYASQVEVLEVMSVPCGGDLPNFDYEEHLSLPMVRHAPADAGLDEISFSDALKLCVFASCDQPVNAAGTVAVYYSTGTVGVSYDHPIHGRVETFRRHEGWRRCV